MESSKRERLEIVKDWRLCFTGNLLRQAETYVKKGQVMEFSCGERDAKATVVTKQNQYAVQVGEAPDGFEAEWNPAAFHCPCQSKYNKPMPYRNQTKYYPVCAHEAAVLLYWEQRRGSWKFQETQEEMEARLERVRLEEERRREQQRREEERRRQWEQDQKDRQTQVSVADFFPKPDDGTFFNIRAAMKNRKITLYCHKRAQAILESDQLKLQTPKIDFDNMGVQVLHAKGSVTGDGHNRFPEAVVSARELESFSCSCQDWYYSSVQPLCEHVLALLVKLRAYVRTNNPGDATDKAAASFFEALSAVNIVSDEPARTVEKKLTFFLSPKIIMDGGNARLSFKGGIQGGKALTIRAYREFLDAVEEEKPFALSKAVTVDFSRVGVAEDSVQWLLFLQRRVSDTETANEQIERKQSRSYYYGYSSTPKLSVGLRDTLIGATLDRFYELAEGTECEFQSKAPDAPASIRIGHMAMRVRMKAKRIGGKEKDFQGVEVTGEMPVILRGSAGSYIFNHRGLSRITREEAHFLRPFREASDKEGKIRFRVGLDHLAEFYYRAVPQLLQSPFIDFEDECAEEAAPLLPPEPVFTFRTDIADGMIVCDAQVAYGKMRVKPILATRAGEYQDTVQEERVDETLRKYFRILSPGRGRYQEENTDESLYRFLTEGLPELERYGEVLGSDAFRRNALRPAPSFRVSVSIESGLLDLAVLSKDADPDELLELLESYRQKKRFHRLKSGEFVTLSENEGFASLEELVKGLDISAEDVILHGAEMPVYRALYLDKLLQEHDALASSRDRTYRALIRNFASIRDADYEVPDAQSDILRPYQVYGYKWLRTLSEAGFGGILADEMGLGKTLQTITLIQSLRDAGNREAALVVCPASLVFNWQEEFSRFAPGLVTVPVAGTAAARKQLLKALSERAQEADAVYITSYDLLRKDIALYDKLRFSVMILDEAQYIKNQKAAMTKAVKSVCAEHRFALTGTPIENRLAEMWSIFDFLMPGFLYNYADFSRRFETPITRNRNPEATARLKRMTGPFILRRVKADVLKDLPPKLEEVRYSRFDDEQRKLYDGQVIRMKELLAQSGENGQDKIRIFAELMRIRQICCDPSLLFEDYSGGSAKREACLELIQNAIGGGHRMLVFSQFTSMLALLESDLNREGIPFCKITGSTPKEQRLRLARDFNEGDTPVFLISLKAGGTGLNLTGADMVIHYDPWWNVAAQNQAADRAHRIGQTRQVTVYRLIAKDTIEEKILALQEAKRDLADAILSGESGSLASLSNEELMALLS